MPLAVASPRMGNGAPHGSKDLAPETNLPSPLNALVGRATDLKGIGEVIGGGRLVTIAGPAGVGKTRLAIELAGRYAARRSQGVWMVDLTASPAPQDVVAETARSLDVNPASGVSAVDAVSGFLAERDALIVLDNCEHVADACAELVAALLTAAPRLRVLATSRQPLGIAGETIWRLEPLAAEHARRLFVERARQRRPEFFPGPDTDLTIARLCERLDRLPLAIELAAARVSIMTPEEVLEALENRVEVLAQGHRGAPDHHRTVRAALDWSYELLDPSERKALRALAVFAGGFDAEAAMAVADGLSFDLLGRLADRSLVSAYSPERGRTRYRLLETVREFALELLSDEEIEAARDRHLRHFAGHAEVALDEWVASGKQHYVNRFSKDYDNVRMAIEHALVADPCAGVRVFSGLRDLFFRFGQAEGFRLGGLLLQRCPARDRDRVVAQLGTAQMAIGMWERESARELLADARSLLSELDEPGIAAWADFFEGLFETMLDGSAESGRSHLERSRNAHRELGIGVGEVRALAILGLSHLIAGDAEAARPLLEEALPIAVAEDDRFGQGQVNAGLGTIALADPNRADDATAHFRRAVEVLAPLRDGTLLPMALLGQADLLSHSDSAKGLLVAGAAAGLRARTGGEFMPFYRARLNHIRELGETTLGPEAQRIWSEGRRLNLEQARAAAFGEPGGQPPGVDGLSRRELEVAGLVSEGLANKEIATRLYLSVRTVESHVRHALAKLALDNRTQLATWARERGR